MGFFYFWNSTVIQVICNFKDTNIFQSTYILIWDIKSYTCVQAHTIPINYLRHKLKAIHHNMILLVKQLQDFFGNS